MPFGETLADEHLNSDNSPFKFNGKQFDEERGNMKTKTYLILLSRFFVLVESPGIEPGSKQAIKELSTRLVSAWVFDIVLGRKLPHNT